MTISTSYQPDTYSGNGSLDTFAISFEFLSDGSNIKVSIKDSLDVITEKTSGSEYNVTGSNVVFTGGNIPTASDTVIIELDPDFLQQSDYTENAALPAETLETDLDERCLESQVNNDLINRAFRLDSSVSLSGINTAVGVPSSGMSVITLTTSGISSTTLATLGAVTIPVEISEGGTGGTTASAARTSLGVAIGSDVQAYDADLDTLSTAFTTASASGGASLTLAEDTDNGTDTITLQAPDAITTSFTLKLPDSDGANNQVIQTDGSGNLSWTNNAGGLADVVDDLTPQLGGQLDVNGNAIGDGTNELLTFTEDASAVNHINIENEATGSGPIISAEGDDSNVDLNIDAKGTGGINLRDGNNNEVLITDAGTASAVNEITITNAATGNSPDISATGDDTNIDLNLATKGTGGLTVNGSTAKIDTILDEDDMVSDDANALATQQSIKAYVDANGGGGSGQSVSCWAMVSQAGTQTLLGHVNVASITDNGTGITTVNWDTDFSSSVYGIDCCVKPVSTDEISVMLNSSYGVVAGSARFETFTSETGSLLDAFTLYVSAYGTLS